MEVRKVVVTPEVKAVSEYVIHLTEKEMGVIRNNIGLLPVPCSVRNGSNINRERLADVLALLHRIILSANLAPEWHMKEDGETYQ